MESLTRSKPTLEDFSGLPTDRPTDRPISPRRHAPHKPASAPDLLRPRVPACCTCRVPRATLSQRPDTNRCTEAQLLALRARVGTAPRRERDELFQEARPQLLAVRSCEESPSAAQLHLLRCPAAQLLALHTGGGAPKDQQDQACSCHAVCAAAHRSSTRER